MMWWWSSTLNVTMHQLQQRGVPPTLHPILTNTIYSNQSRNDQQSPLVKNNLALWILLLPPDDDGSDDDSWTRSDDTNSNFGGWTSDDVDWWWWQRDVDGWIVMMVMNCFGWPNRHRKHQRFKMMQMAIWYIIPTTFSITDVRDNFCENLKLQLFNFFHYTCSANYRQYFCSNF